TETDCPLGFECVDRGGSPQVCIPDEQLGSTDRTCPADPGGDYQCFDSGDCGRGESCIDNECVAPNGECTADADCGGAAVCRNFECVEASTPECLDRTDCASNHVCVDGTCQPRNPGGNCIKNSECGGGAVCVNGSCLTRCSDRSECNTDTEICRQGLCVPTDCAPNETCVDAQCKPSCADDGDCASGYVCNRTGGYCERDPTVECRSDSECLSGEACHNGTWSQTCNCNQQCGDGRVCNMAATDASTTGLCESADPADAPSSCQNDCDCPSGQTCQDGTCR
ncbi:MAG: hypothetical protein ABEN55_20700, partial [Bradymonadaceae bacterium]